MKRGIKSFPLLLISIVMLAGCGNYSKNFEPEREINVVSREEGSGTRGAFVELFKIEEKSNGRKKDLTKKSASVVSNTDIMLNNIAQDRYAIGYVSTGSLNDNIKTLKIDGADATSENIKNGSYKIARPFNIAFKEKISEATQDFINFILSKEGQEIVAKSYTSVDDAPPNYKSSVSKGKVSVGGSSSVSPIMEKLKEGYAKANPDVTVEVQMSDSTAGIRGAIDGTFDIGMASRDLVDSESAELVSAPIALDGLAIIVNPKNPTSELTTEQVSKIFKGNINKWTEVKK